MTHLTLSIVVPVYSGADYLESLAVAIDTERTKWAQAGVPCAISQAIFVADAPIDDSISVLEELERRFSWLDVVTLGRNYGQHPATIAGVLHSSADWVVTLDEDLQHRPADILSLLRTASEANLDVVYARPVSRVHAGYRDFASRFYKRLIARATGIPEVLSFSSFRLIRGSVARAAASVSGHETYFDVALTWFTDRFGSTQLTLVDERHQSTGRSGYSFRSLVSHARRMIVSSQAKALRLGAVVGLLAVVVALVMTTVAVVTRITDPESVTVRGWLSLFVGVLFFGGVVSLLLAVSLEYLTNIVQHTQGKPTFFSVDRSDDRVLREYFSSQNATSSPDG
jgi:glycosyltransferase involved in cell wall biosynthesis